MDTATIHYRVADYLKKYPPFQAMDEPDLLELAGQGRVKFFEMNEFIVVQGSPYLWQVFVIQQGTVTLWDEQGEVAQLHDVRGVGDFLGIEQFNGVDAYPYTARAGGDVVVYVFPAVAFEALVLKYDYAKQYVAAYDSVSAGYKPAQEQRDPQDMFLHELVAGRPLPVCDSTSSIRQAAQVLVSSGADAIVVVGSENQPRAALTATSVLEWISLGGNNCEEPVGRLVLRPLAAVAPDCSVAEAAMVMGAADAGALAMTEDGTADARLHAIITPRDLTPVFGDHPVTIIEEIRHAASIDTLRDLNQRARAFVLRRLTSAAAVEWLTRFTSMVDAGLVKQLIAIMRADDPAACWCFSGTCGRGESLTRVAPELFLITDDGQEAAAGVAAFHRVSTALGECGYLPTASLADRSDQAAGVGEWTRRYRGWISDPVVQNMYSARQLFDLKPIHGALRLWAEVDGVVRAAINHDFLHLVANDCLESLPPLTFYEDAVIADSGEESAVFRLEYSALAPLVDVGRVFGLSAGRVLGSSTLERFAIGRTLFPDRTSIFREAADTLRVVLWQQGRVGISQNTDGAELPPALLGRYDRRLLKSGFRSISRLLEFAGNPQWLKTI